MAKKAFDKIMEGATEAVTMAQLMAENQRLRDRLEIDPSHPYDGIYARDETIRLLDAEVERLREALRECHHVLHKLMAIVPGNDTAVDEMAKAMKKARAALGEDKW